MAALGLAGAIRHLQMSLLVVFLFVNVAAGMPEMSECTALTRILKDFIIWVSAFTTMRTAGLKVFNLWADPTDPEIAHAMKNPSENNVRTRAHCVERLDPSSNNFIRGGCSKSTQKKLVPPPEVLDVIGGIENLTLVSVSGNPRNIILRFAQCFCQVCTESYHFLVTKY